MTDPTLAAIDAAKEDYTRGTSKGRHGLHSGSYKYATVDTILAALDLARAVVEMQAWKGFAIELVNAQSEDDGLWFQAKTAPENYLQQELRKLHSAVESDWHPLTAAVDKFRESVK